MDGTWTPVRAGAVRRAAGLLVVVVVMAALVSSCGSTIVDGPTDAQLAAQDKAVERANREERARAREIAARYRAEQRLLALRRMAVGRANAARVRAAQANAARNRIVISRGNPRILTSIGFTPATLCAPIRGGGAAGKQARKNRERQRRAALRYLNLRC